MNRPRVVFDTNVLVSAVLFGQGTPARALEAAVLGSELIVSADVIRELERILAKPKFERYVTEAERALFIASLLREATLIPVTTSIQVCRDPKDDKFLELAVGGGANVLVTGDQDLLVLHPFRGVDILPPGQFLTWLDYQKG